MKRILEKIHLPQWLCIFLALILILRIPSFFEPYSYGDEMIYLTLGEGIRQGVPLYKELHDNKPPALYITAAVAGSLFWFKAILAFWNLITIVLFWKLSLALFPKKEKLAKVATIIFGLLTTLPILEGNIANAELFMIAFTLAGFLILLTKSLNFKHLFISGVLFSLATLFKIPAAFDVLAIVFLWLLASDLKKERLALLVRNTFYLFLGFAIPIAASLLWFWANGALKEYLVAGFLQNVGYLSSFRPGDVQKSFLIRNLPLIIRTGVLALGLFILYLARKRLSKQFIFLTGWLLFALFAVTLSERPYPHYLIQAVAPISFLFAILFTQKSFEQSLAIIPLTLVFFVPVYFRFYYYPTSPYYLRFLEFALGKIDRQKYFARFDGKVNRNYEIANFIATSSTKNDKIFVWGDSPPVYALSRRLPPFKYVADYHINDFSSKEEALAALVKNKPKFIVILPEAPPFGELTALLRKNYGKVAGVDEAEIWLRMNLR